MEKTYEFIDRVEATRAWRKERGLGPHDHSQDHEGAPLSFASAYPGVPPAERVLNLRDMMGQAAPDVVGACTYIWQYPEYRDRAEMILIVLRYLQPELDLSHLRDAWAESRISPLSANHRPVVSLGRRGYVRVPVHRDAYAHAGDLLRANLLETHRPWVQGTTMWSRPGLLSLPWLSALRPAQFGLLDWLLMHQVFGLCLVTRGYRQTLAFPVLMDEREAGGRKLYRWVVISEDEVRAPVLGSGPLLFSDLWATLDMPPEPKVGVEAVQEPCSGMWMTANSLRRALSKKADTSPESHLPTRHLPSYLQWVWKLRSPSAPEWRMSWNSKFCLQLALEARSSDPEVLGFLEGELPYPRHLIGIDLNPKPKRRLKYQAAPASLDVLRQGFTYLPIHEGLANPDSEQRLSIEWEEE